ncbi:MAG: hypothetical protein HKN23_20765, partial [Verrucomicrobiales bacterium]|nr:hypothetical protein [Verrucomicrobiales bacterium]
VMAVSVGGLWKWSLNPRSEASNNVYDKFWNQLLLNLIARSGARPSDRMQLTVSSANVQKGEKIHFTLQENPEKPIMESPRLNLFVGDQPVTVLPLNRENPDAPWRATYVADTEGRFRGILNGAGDTAECRFVVYREQRETTEVTPDFSYLRKLADQSGGRVLDESTLKETVAQLSQAAVAEADAPPIIKRKSAWDRTLFFYLLFFLLGLEWFLRRRWGLV